MDMSDALSTLKDHTPTLPSASDVRDAVQSHLPSVDMDSMRELAKDKAPGKRSIMAILAGVAIGAMVLIGLLRRRRNASSPANLYTPPLPKP
jgi:hypothetical protein